MSILPGSGSLKAVVQQHEREALQGHYFIVWSGPLTLAPAGNTHARTLLRNPTNSGKTAYIERFTISSVAGNSILSGNMFVNPTLGLPSATFAPTPANIGSGLLSVLTYACDVAATPMSGGQLTSFGYAVGPFLRQIEMPPLILRPGISLGFDDVSLLGSPTFEKHFYWYEL